MRYVHKHHCAQQYIFNEGIDRKESKRRSLSKQTLIIWGARETPCNRYREWPRFLYTFLLILKRYDEFCENKPYLFLGIFVFIL